MAKELLTRRYEVSLLAVEGNIAPDHAVDQVITGAVNLGFPIRLRVCLSINGAAGDTRTMFGLYWFFFLSQTYTQSTPDVVQSS